MKKVVYLFAFDFVITGRKKSCAKRNWGPGDIDLSDGYAKLSLAWVRPRLLMIHFFLIHLR